MAEPNWHRRGLIQLASAAALVLPVALVAWRNARLQASMTLDDLLVAPLVVGGALVFWILFLHLFVCADDVDAFGFRGPRPGRDVLLGVGLAAVLLTFNAWSQPLLLRVFPPRPPVPQILTLLRAVASNPWLLALWLGPVVWIGIALFEELARVFLLRRLSLLRPDGLGRWAAILVVSALVGLVHAYQGSAAIVSIGLQSVLLGWVFFRTGRIRGLIVAHGLYDSFQIVMAVITIRQLGP